MPYLIYAFVILQRILELFWSHRNTSQLKKLGAEEFFASHYKWIVFFHLTWLVILGLAIHPEVSINTIALLIFVILQFCRMWVLLTLGARWTTRILRFPNENPIDQGPYRWLRHPNYIIVVGEIFVVPLIFYLWQLSLGGTIVHGLLITHRIKKENEAWAR